MHIDQLEQWQHSHDFSSNYAQAERTTKQVMLLTAVTMVVEIIAGTLFGSMALLSDGWHMATHVAAFGITLFTYYYARRHANSPSYSFGTGKVSVLGGFASAIALAVIAFVMALESMMRLLQPQTIRFNEAVAVAVLGLVINVISGVMLHEHHGHEHHGHEHHGHEHHRHEHHAQEHYEHGREHHGQQLGSHEQGQQTQRPQHPDQAAHLHRGHEYHGHEHHEHDHQSHDHDSHDHDSHDHQSHGQEIIQQADHQDHNLRAAYFHVLADALTSVFAILALLMGKFLGWNWMDPIMGIVGAVVITRWAYGLVQDTSRILLDGAASPSVQAAIRAAIESDADNRITDLHVWSLGTGHLAATVSLVTHYPQAPAHYKALSGMPELAHLIVEVHPCQGRPCIALQSVEPQTRPENSLPIRLG